MSAGYLRRCANKKRFENKAEAESSRSSLVRDTGKRKDSFNVYRCDQCSGWHVGGTSGVYAGRNRKGRRK